MMAGVLVTSIGSGQLISRLGRYKPFPIIGTALMTVAMYLLSGISVSMPIWQTALYMLVLGFGLGMTMQVLVLAAQNAVPYEQLGVATSGSTLFRQVGGSIGVSVFGAIFANQLASNLADALPPGTQLPDAVSPGIIAQLPAAVHALYLDAFVTALGPVFSVAAAVSLLGFGLTWLLREVPLRKSARQKASPRASRPHVTRSRCRSWSGSWPRSPGERTAGGSTSRWPTRPRSISIRPSCGCSHGSERTPLSTSTIPNSSRRASRFASGV